MTRRRVGTAVILAMTGLTAIAVGRHESPATESAVTTASPAAPRVTAPATVQEPAVLTRGELLPTSPPTHLDIPALRVSVAVIGLGLQPDGSMQVPADARTVGWYTKAPTPGSLGPAVLAGHVDFGGTAGTFAGLPTLRPGDRIEVTRNDHTTAVFAVTRAERYAKDRFPSDAVYGPIDHAGLRLITCGGDYNPRSGHYVDNVVVYAELQEAVAATP